MAIHNVYTFFCFWVFLPLGIYQNLAYNNNANTSECSVQIQNNKDTNISESTL